MRRRLVVAFIGLTALVITLYLVPRAFVVADLIHDAEQHRVDDTATLVAHIIDDGTARVSPSFLDSINGDYEWVVVHRGASTITTTGASLGAAHNDLTATRPLSGGGTVTVGLSASVVSSAQSDALVPLILLGVGLVLLAGLAGYVLAWRFARPFRELAEAARGLGRGALRPALPHYRVGEARAIAKALSDSGEQIEAMLQHERTLAAHASHELRTPIAALRLELEDLALWPETPAAVAAQLQTATGDLDRLSTAVADLLTMSREHRERVETRVDVEALVEEALKQLEAGQGRVVHLRSGVVPAKLDPQPVIRLIRTLIEGVLGSSTGDVLVSSVNVESHIEVRMEPDVPTDAANPVASLTTDLARSLDAQVARRGDTVVLRLPLHLAT